MPKGGHAHSGPAKDPTSRTSERAGFAITALPSEGFSGEAPDLAEFLPAPTEQHEHEWAELWATPQACVWARERWRWTTVADLVNLRVRSFDPDAPAAVATSIRQLRDDLGLSRAGLAVHGWTIAQDETAPKREEKAAVKSPSSRERMKVVKGSGG